MSAQYIITRSLWRRDYEVSTGGVHLYHVDNSYLTPGKPDLTCHAGPDSSAPVVGVCKYHHFSSDAEIGLGDPSKPGTMTWERLNRDGLMSVQSSFRVMLEDRILHRFTWKRTHSRGTSLMDNLKLVCDRTGELIAVFSGRGGLLRRTSQLDIYPDYGERFQFMVLLTGLALYEKLRRATSATVSSVGAAGASGGGA
ncbi:uncharacterized protein N7459_006196 [Penicillium hispanicum]|uniref:uncharacterized protein n=1 Tax=Penicillium hispanicum TaxID=1080232 RepID=UPI0025419500|nr:uncharacterized protein N7459_006196 [Penicillium hispanicum]KAJ5580211.1 hypothetical protein N7459_006196 [Penicillium hispanicum]